MRRIRMALRAVMIVVLNMVGLPICESQEQRRKIEDLSKQVAKLQQENSRLEQAVANLTREKEDLEAQLESAMKKPQLAKK